MSESDTQPVPQRKSRQRRFRARVSIQPGKPLEISEETGCMRRAQQMSSNCASWDIDEPQ
jgi:hypothetical protein